MGWISYSVFSANINRKIELDKELWSCCRDTHELLKSRMVGSTYYAAAKYKPTGQIIAYVVLTSIQKEPHGYGYEFFYKEICETFGPTEAKCPESILKLLTETDDREANEWRNRCHEYNRKEKIYKTKKDLKGICKYDLDCGYKKGDEIELYWYEIEMFNKNKGFYTDRYHRFTKHTILELENLQYV